MVDKQMLENVVHFKAEFREAKNKFNADGSSLEIRARTTIMSLNQMNVALDMVHEGARITAEFFASCEAIILSLDDVCRPMLKKSPKCESVKAVADLMEEINDEVSATSTNFSVSLNGECLGDLGSLQPIASIQAQVIQKYWTSYYSRMPDYKSMQKKQADKKTTEIKKTKTKIEQINAIEKNNEALRKTADDLTRKHMEKANEFKAALNARISTYTMVLTQNAKREASELAEIKNNKLKELESLGLFKFAEKKRLRLEIEEVEGKIAIVLSPQYNANEIQKLEEKANTAVSEYQKEINDFCSSFVDVTSKTESVAKEIAPPPISKCQNSEERAILNCMVTGHWYTAIDLLGIVPSLPDNYTTQKLVPRLRSLVDNGYLENETIEGRVKYCLAGPYKTVKYEIITLDEQKMNLPCPDAPDVDSVLGLC